MTLRKIVGSTRDEEGVGHPRYHGEVFHLPFKEGDLTTEVVKGLNNLLPVPFLHGNPGKDKLGGILINFRFI